MASTVGTRPNHYELLGLTPKATSEEVARAFAQAMSLFRPHSFRDLAGLSVAYETLRDPARRRAYDASIGLAPEPRSSAVRQGWQFVGSVRAGPVARPAGDPLHRPAPQPLPEQQPRLEESVDARVAAITAKLKQLSEPRPEAEQPPVAEPKRDAAVEPVIEHIISVGRAEKDRLRGEGRSFEWKRPAVAVLGLVLGVGLVGAWAGMTAGNEVEAEQSGRAVTLPVPPPKAAPAVTASEPVAEASFAEPPAERPMRVARARRAPAPTAIKPAEPLADVAEVLQNSAEPTAEPAVADAQPVAATSAKLPLSNATIARTIGRIGYACGEVASAAAVDGHAGVFNVTCTSGHTYRAAPVRGRYHFRRVAGP